VRDYIYCIKMDVAFLFCISPFVIIVPLLIRYCVLDSDVK
jgi:hypothetical protein